MAGEEIPLGVRIIAVVDTYDAMTTHRPYRAAMPHEMAVHELQRTTGTQFDPRIVEAITFTSGDYGLAAGTVVEVQVCIGDALVGTAQVRMVLWASALPECSQDYEPCADSR